jgi:putative ATP-dependent endonuclease of OLD family
LLAHALGKGLGYELDDHGVSVIDAKNNGNPDTFAALARALGIPWIAVFDGDPAGLGYVRAIAGRDFAPAFVDDRCKTLPAGTLEQQLLADGFEPELRKIMQSLGQTDPMTMDLTTLEKCLAKNKVRYAAELASMIAVDPLLAERMPQPFRDGVLSLRGLTG